LAGAAPDVHARLLTPGAAVADLACGAGWSSIALARAYPALRVDGSDLDEASIADARRNAADAGVADRVHFEVADAGRPASPRATYDLVTIFEAVHDMSHPVDALRACHALRGGGAAVIIMDERTAPSFAESDGPIEQFLYGASVLHCLPVGMADDETAATGALMRPDTFATYATAAGFERVDELDVAHDLYRLYRLS
jgi:2-polyprenyl-3-methyl-5-hydroxy-6-metoxy-1,4-benzoquinol methylase